MYVDTYIMYKYYIGILGMYVVSLCSFSRSLVNSSLFLTTTTEHKSIASPPPRTREMRSKPFFSAVQKLNSQNSLNTQSDFY